MGIVRCRDSGADVSDTYERLVAGTPSPGRARKSWGERLFSVSTPAPSLATALVTQTAGKYTDGEGTLDNTQLHRPVLSGNGK